MKLFSSRSTIPDKPHLRWQTWGILLLATFLSLGGYLVYSVFSYRLGFPLDDSWIHQTYARNLALRGEWAFLPGQVSGGSTSPLWSVLLAVGFLLDISPYLWTFAIGGLLLFVLAVQTELTLRRLVENYRGIFPWAGLLIVCEWHLTWASASGMETLLHALLVFFVLSMLLCRDQRWLLLGALTGLSVWVRPDGITLLGPLVFVVLFDRSEWRRKIRSLVSVLIGFGVFLSLYIFFNLSIAGMVFPTTFYAKQAEYVDWQALPIWKRTAEVLLKVLTGAGVILLPGMILSVRSALRTRDWGVIASFIWAVGYIAIYIMRLPPYQHARYLIPSILVLVFLGLLGYVRYVSRKTNFGQEYWFIKTSWSVILLTISVAFWFLGMQAYGDDVEFIESEMVDSARWVAVNVPDGALVAAHDIGALGYFGNHNVLDLAGLISPEVIPILRDEAALADYLDENGVTYLVAFPDWYPLLTSDLQPVYVTGGTYTLSLGQTNMAIYLWPGP